MEDFKYLLLLISNMGLDYQLLYKTEEEANNELKTTTYYERTEETRKSNQKQSCCGNALTKERNHCQGHQWQCGQGQKW